MLSEIEKYIDKNNSNDYEELYKNLKNMYSNNLSEIKFVLYDKYKYQHTNKELKNKRDKQEEFRKKLIELDKECIISGDDAEQCQACHIIPVCESKSYDVNNGILLNFNLHNMFDRHKLKLKYIKNINKEYDLYTIILSDEIKNKKGYDNYKIYDNKEIKIRKGCRKNLENKFKNN
jgi:hypothetical protein